MNNKFLSSNITVLKVILSSYAKQADITAFVTYVFFFKFVYHNPLKDSARPLSPTSPA